MSELYFRLGEMKGFTAIDLADKKEGYANPIRELMQNSLDASREAGNSKCEINIYIEAISKRQIPHIAEYESVLEKAIQNAKNQGSFNANSQQRVTSIQNAIKEKSLKVLMFSDNGTGMKQEQIEALLTGGVSIKGEADEKSGGSFGVGNLSSYSLSSLRYVLYATKYKNDNGVTKQLFTGSPILAGHRDGNAQRGNRGRIVTKKPGDEMDPKFTYPEDPPDFIGRKMEHLARGTIVVVLGLSEDWGEDAEYAIVCNFFHAIAHESISVTVPQDGIPKAISYDKVERLIASRKDQQRKRGDHILSGKAVWQAWQAVKENQKTIELSNSDKVYVYIKSDNNTDSVIVLIRNGMVIARHDSMLSSDMNDLRKGKNFQPFTAVIDVDQQNAPELFGLVKKAEGPYHSQLQATQLGSEEDKKRLKKLFKELSEKIKEHLKAIERDSFDLPLFPVPDKAKPQTDGNNRNRKSGQVEKASPPPAHPRPPKPKKPEEGKGKKRPKPVVISRNLKSKNAVRYTDEANQWRVRLRVIPQNQENAKDAVYLSMCVGEDNDNEETKMYLDFTTVQINGQTIEIPDSVEVEEDGKLMQVPANKSQVKLGSLDQSRQYDIIAEVKKPDEIGDMKVALLPILGLKYRKSRGGDNCVRQSNAGFSCLEKRLW